MTKTAKPQTAEKKHEAQRKQRGANSIESSDLDEALEESFPASDPPAMTQPETEIGAPNKARKPERNRS